MMAFAALDIITTMLERCCAALDSDHDGHVDRQDCQRLADRCLDVCRLGPDDRRARALDAFLRTCWLELLRRGCHALLEGTHSLLGGLVGFRLRGQRRAAVRRAPTGAG
ncbi:hypothetical protein GT204_07125 [Streptomyces sp. SID4919]|uniref:hypothetical protein n=1 Tax=unclassified Streptomyces TaxID=2593676 RepID=UPI000823889D|nr:MULTISPECIES: hypothetical protein [unclassified Streptomyces]MYY08680.1 hypothetical protein [Streptomyces sp. SID4919]SCK55880.1 hypothetical protein YW7DRAFT_05189 [Streptomyces sp. AmelKG-E11A]